MTKCTMNYIGSKYNLLEFIEEVITSKVNIKESIMCDLFGGTNIVSRYFKTKVKEIISNDIEYYSYIMAKCYIENNNVVDCSMLEKYLPEEGFITKNYSDGSGRLYFTRENGMIIDGVRKALNPNDPNYFVHLTSLVEASDKVANTASVYGAFLKKIKKSAAKKIKFETPVVESGTGKSYNEDAATLIEKISGDVLYMDPPYNNRQYSQNYHLLNTIAKFDDFVPKGKTGQRVDNTISDFCSKKKACATLEHILEKCNFKHIFISYNNEGIINIDEFAQICSKYGKYEVFKKNYRTFKSDSNRNNKSTETFEYIHYINK
jgi:adenine-specific DNA-methyltransferase